MILDLIKRRNEIVSHRLEKVFYIFGADSPDFHSFAKDNKDVEFTPQFDREMLIKDSLIVFDDYGMAISSSQSMNDLMTSLVTKEVNHSKVSLIIVLHNLFGKNLRAISLSQVRP